MTRLMTTETEQNNFFREGKIILQNMQDNMQARKCKIPTERLKKCTVSTQHDENQHQDRTYDSDDQYTDFEDAESVEAYDDNELDQDDYNDEMDDARNLKDLKKGEELSKSKIIDSRQLENDSIFLSDTTGDDLNHQGQHQGSENQNAATNNNFGSSKYKTLLAFVSGAIVGNSTKNDDGSVSLSEEEVQLVSGLHKHNGINANDWIELGFSSNFNR